MSRRSSVLVRLSLLQHLAQSLTEAPRHECGLNRLAGGDRLGSKGLSQRAEIAASLGWRSVSPDCTSEASSSRASKVAKYRAQLATEPGRLAGHSRRRSSACSCAARYLAAASSSAAPTSLVPAWTSPMWARVAASRSSLSRRAWPHGRGVRHADRVCSAPGAAVPRGMGARQTGLLRVEESLAAAALVRCRRRHNGTSCRAASAGGRWVMTGPTRARS